MRTTTILYIMLLITCWSVSGCTDVEENLQNGDNDQDAESVETDAAESETDEIILPDGDTMEDGDQAESETAESDGDDFEFEIDDSEESEYLPDGDVETNEAEQTEDEESDGDDDSDLELEDCEFGNWAAYEYEIDVQNEPVVTPNCIQVEESFIRFIGEIDYVGGKLALNYSYVNPIYFGTDGGYPIGNKMLIVDAEDSSAPVIEFEDDVLYAKEAPHNLLAAASTVDKLLIYKPEDFDGSTDPINQIYCPECDFSEICFTGNRAYWLSKNIGDGTRQLMAGTLDEDGHLTYGARSATFPVWGSIRSYYYGKNTHLICTENSVAVFSTGGAEIAMMGGRTGWTITHIPTISADLMAAPTLVFSKMGGGGMQLLTGFGTAHAANENTLLTNLYISTVGTPGPASEYSSKAIYDFSNTCNAQYLGEHGHSVYGWLLWQGDSVWTREPAGAIALNTLSPEMSLEQTATFSALHTVQDMDKDGDKAYLSLISYGVQAVDLSNIANPEAIFDKPLTMSNAGVRHIIPDGERIFTLRGDNALTIFDENDPFNSTFKLDLGITPAQVIKDGNMLHAIQYKYDSLLLVSVDLSKTDDQALIASNTIYLAADVNHREKGRCSLEGNILYSAHHSLSAIDISDLQNPSLLWELQPQDSTTEVRFTDFEEVEAVNGHLVVLADDNQSDQLSLVVLQANGNTTPTLIGTIENIAKAVAYYGESIFTAKSVDDHLVLQKIDFTTPTDPIISTEVHRSDIELRINWTNSNFLSVRDGYLLIDFSVKHMIDIENSNDLSVDTYTFPFYSLNDFHAVDRDNSSSFWFASGSSQPAFLKLNFDSCKP